MNLRIICDKFSKFLTLGKNQAGFTIIELLTVIMIIFFLSAMLFANYRSGNSQLSLELEANKVASDIRIVQEMGMSAPQVPGYADQSIGGYGVYFAKDSQSYVFFVDTNPSGGDGVFEGGGSGDTVLQTISLDADYYIASVDSDSASILFLPPEPATNIKGGAGDLEQVTVKIAAHADPTKTRSIVVNRAGLIYVR